MAEMITFSFSTVIGGPETTAIKYRGSAKSSVFQLLIRSNVHSPGVCGGNKPLLQVIKLPREHILITTRPIPWHRFSKATTSPIHGSMNGGSAVWNSGCAQTPCHCWLNPCPISGSVKMPWGPTYMTKLDSKFTRSTKRRHCPKSWALQREQLEAQSVSERIMCYFWGIGSPTLHPNLKE